jgi:DNA-binding LacI/PurR family transcriptional regulator
MHRRRVTQSDIAAKLGVSIATVNLALKNHHRISLKRRTQVKRLAEKMGYLPDPFLSGLAAYRRRHGDARYHGVIGWINHWAQPESLHQFGEFEEYWAGAKETAKPFGYSLEEIRWPADCPAKKFERILLARGILGVLIPPHRQSLDWGNFDWSKFSLIRFGMSVHQPDSNMVTSDQARAVVMAVTKMHAYGYNRIGMIVERELDRALGGNNFSGFDWAQELLATAGGIPPFSPNREQYRDRPEAGLERLHCWLNEQQPEAILTSEPQIPDQLRQLGYRIPRDIAVAGTSVRDIPVDAGIDQRSREIGRIAVEMLVKQIGVNERGEPTAPSRILVESGWQDGKSLPRRR